MLSCYKLEISPKEIGLECLNQVCAWMELGSVSNKHGTSEVDLQTPRYLQVGPDRSSLRFQNFLRDAQEGNWQVGSSRMILFQQRAAMVISQKRGTPI